MKVIRFILVLVNRERFLTAVLGCLTGLVCISASADPIPANRKAPWDPGVAGGIPQRASIYRTLYPTNTLADINNAIASCPSNSVVFLSAGTYSLSGNIIINRRNGITIRGAGPGQTILQFNTYSWADIYFLGQDFNDPNTSTPANLVNWTGGYAQGSTNLTLSSTAGLSVGTMLMVDQLNDNIDVNGTGSEGCSYCGRSAGGRAQIQAVTLTGISGNNVSIYPPIYMPNWSATYSPQAWWFGGTLERTGIEDLSIVNTSSGSDKNIAFKNARNCWAKNIDSSSSVSSDHYHVKSYMASRIEVRHCWFHGVMNQPGSDHYGVDWFWGWDCLAIDNIFDGVVSPLVLEASSEGNVNAYNFCTNMLYYDPTWQLAGLMGHAAHNSFNLFEGNMGNEIYLDFIHGSGSHTTALRNRITGYEQGRTGNTYCFSAQCTNHYDNVVGNVFGTAGYHNVYECANGGCGTVKAIYYLGYNGTSGAYPTGYDPAVPATMIRAANYDVVTRPTVDPSDVPYSYFLPPSKPAFFGDRPWPFVNPATPATAVATNLPAGYRYFFQTDPPTGPQNLPPIIQSFAASPVSGNAPLTVSFSATARDPEGVSVTYSWDFGDGHTSVSPNPTNTFTSQGTNNVRLNVSDGVNTTTTNISIRVTIAGYNAPPIASAAAAPLSGPAPLAVSFFGTNSYDPEGTPLSYSWNFGDGGTSTAANPTHTYAASGTYVAQLTVSDGTNTSTPSTATVTAGTAANGLVAAYAFEENSGTVANDVSGNGNTGVISGTTWANQGKFGHALSFNGTSDLILVNGSSSLNISSAITEEAWVYPTAAAANWSAVMHREADAWYLHASSPAGSMVPAGGATFNGTESYVSANTSIPLNAWTHLAMTYDGATMRFYVNGLLSATKAASGTIQTNANPLRIGGNTYGQYFQGLIDEVRVYNRALSQAEIHSDMNTPVSGFVTKPNVPPGVRVASQ